MTQKSPKISVQLYSLRNELAKSYEGVIEKLCKIGFKYVEPAGYPGSSAKEAHKIYSNYGLLAPSCHGQLPIGPEKNALIEEYLMMGHDTIITGCPPGFQENYISESSVKKMAEKYCEAAYNLEKHGLQIGYHNHDWDLIDINGKPAYQIFLKNTPDSVMYEADLYWVTKAGINPSTMIKELGQRGKYLHFKDGLVNDGSSFTKAETESGKIMVSEGIPFLPAGKGQVDLKKARENLSHTEYVVVELDSYRGDMLEAIEESYHWFVENGIGK